ncbi:hypothetical protein GCM10010326_59710 [Streptomyces xanthochromogenes]|uniref:Uncharacterized protein n=1 Tax=Streptomyces xanthochromogenes TaxID=67384 RepID=A0ABQ3AII3_9ACTN|nr:hypothetical protein GCM10010326_59710 [Streptomyces xanthochromogenes]
MSRNFNRASDCLDAAREMAKSGRPTLARLLAEEAAARTPDSPDRARLLSEFPGRSLKRED